MRSFGDPLHTATSDRLRLIARVQIAGQAVQVYKNTAARPYVSNFAGRYQVAHAIDGKAGGVGGFFDGTHAGE